MNKYPNPIMFEHQISSFDFPDTLYGFLNFITQDETGVFSKYKNFEKSLKNLYYHTNPNEFCESYKIFVEEKKNDSNRKYLCGDDKKIKTIIEGIYKIVKSCEKDPSDNRPPYFIFGLILWLNIWH